MYSKQGQLKAAIEPCTYVAKRAEPALEKPVKLHNL